MLGSLWERSPWSTKFAALFAIAGWFVQAGGVSKTTVNGVVTDCSGVDAGALVGGALAIGLAALGWFTARKRHEKQRPPHPAFLVISALIAAVGVALLVRFGLDPDGRFCA